MDSIDNKDAEIFVQNLNKHNINNDTQFLISLVNMKETNSLLDIGYGSGTFIQKMKKNKPDLYITGIEKSRYLYQYSYSIMKEINIEIVNKAYLNWKHSIQYDLITMSFFLHHIDDYYIYLHKAKQEIQVNGKLIIMDRIALQDDYKEKFKLFWEKEYKKTHEWKEECPNILSRSDIISASAKLGFIVEGFYILPDDRRLGTENFPKTVAILKSRG